MSEAEEFIKSMFADKGWKDVGLCVLCADAFDYTSPYCKDGLCQDCSLMMYPYKSSTKNNPSATKTVDVSGVRTVAEVDREEKEEILPAEPSDAELIKSWDEQSAEIDENLAWTHGPWSMGMDF